MQSSCITNYKLSSLVVVFTCENGILVNQQFWKKLILMSISGSKEYAKTLGLEWNTTFDHFRLIISNLSPPEIITKCTLVSDIAKIFDVLGWFSPTVIKMKMLLHRLWELKIAWDDLVPTSIQEIWLQWLSELPSLANCHLPRYYFPKSVTINSLQVLCTYVEKIQKEEFMFP